MQPTSKTSRTRLAATSFLATLALAAPAVARQESVPLETARLHAALGMLDGVLGDNPFLEGWSEASLGEPVLFFDLSGVPLVYEFPAMLGEEQAGRIEVAAAPALGAGVLGYAQGPRPIPLLDATWLALWSVQWEHEGAAILGALPVRYEAFSDGLAVSYLEPGAEQAALAIVDLLTLEMVPPDRWRSVLQELPPEDLRRRMSGWEGDDEAYAELADTYRAASLEPLTIYEGPFDTEQLEVAATVSAERFSTERHVTVDLSRCRLYLQEHSDWCARAFLRMMNRFHLGTPLHTQTQIDSELNGMGWATNWQGALSFYLNVWTGLTQVGYSTLAGQFSDSQWALLQAEIAFNRPLGLQDGTDQTAHIVMVVGWGRSEEQIPNSVFGPAEVRWVHVYDSASGMHSRKLTRGGVVVYFGALQLLMSAQP